MKLDVEIAKKGKLASLKDPIGSFLLTEAEKQVIIDSGKEGEKLLQLSKTISELDPDIILTNGGDAYLFSYLIQMMCLKNLF